MIKIRDNYIDIVKGLLMLSVINIHTVYWPLFRHTPDIVRQLAYFIDIPIFFFISGYLLRSNGFIESLKSFLRQFIRLFSHYILVSLLLFMGTFCWFYMVDGRLISGLADSLISIMDVNLRGELWDYIYGYNGSLWYIRVYFSMMLIIPLYTGLQIFKRMRIYGLFFMVLFYSLTNYQYSGHAFIFTDYEYVAFYSIFFLLGSIYQIEEKRIQQRDLLISLAITCLLCGMIYHFDNNELRLSQYKFPPTFQYLLYSLPLLHLFALIKSRWNLAGNSAIGKLLKPLAWAGKNSYILFLFQGAVCSLPRYFLSSFPVNTNLGLYGAVFAFNVALSLLLTWCYVICSSKIQSRTTRLLSTAKQQVKIAYSGISDEVVGKQDKKQDTENQPSEIEKL